METQRSTTSSNKHFYNNVKYLLPENLTVHDYFFSSILQMKFERIRYLIRNGMNVNTRDLKTRKTPLMICLAVDDDERRAQIFRLLLNNQADHTIRDRVYSRDTFRWAIQFNRMAEVRKLSDMYPGGLGLSARDTLGQTVLHIAALVGNEEMVTFVLNLLEKYAVYCEVDDRFGFRPYLHARRLGHRRAAEVLSSRGYGSAHQFDSRYFMSANVWQQIGELELQWLDEYYQLHRTFSESRRATTAPVSRTVDVGCPVCRDLHGVGLENKYFRIPKRLCIDCLEPIIVKYKKQEERKTSRSVQIRGESVATQSVRSALSRETTLERSLKPLLDVWTSQYSASFRPSTSRTHTQISDMIPLLTVKSAKLARTRKRSAVPRYRRPSEMRAPTFIEPGDN